MIRGLKIAMIVYGVLGILMGLALILAPYQLGDMLGYQHGGPEYIAGYIASFLASLGVCMIAPSVFLIAAARDPLRHISWVKFAILWAILVAVIDLFSVIRGYIDFGQAGMGIILNAVFAVAFLALYPYRATRSSQ